MNDHGSHAVVGDYVRIVNPAGVSTECRGIVYREQLPPPLALSRDRYLYVHGMDCRIKDSYCRIVSRASRKEF